MYRRSWGFTAVWLAKEVDQRAEILRWFMGSAVFHCESDVFCTRAQAVAECVNVVAVLPDTPSAVVAAAEYIVKSSIKKIFLVGSDTGTARAPGSAARLTAAAAARAHERARSFAGMLAVLLLQGSGKR